MQSNLKQVVSVVVLAYNHAPYIRKCLESVIQQETDFDFEIVIGEDNSTDGTRDICKEFARSYSDKVVLVLRERKDVTLFSGLANGRSNFLECLSKSAGKYVAIIDGDDYWSDPYKLQKQVQILESRDDLVAVHTWQKIAKRDKTGAFFEAEAPRAGHGYLAKEQATVRDIFMNSLRIKSRTIMFRRNAFMEIPEWYKTRVAYGDVPLTMILGKKGDFAFIDEETAVYRQTGEGVSSRYQDKWGTYRHFINWIVIWEFGNNYHKHAYWKEARLTILRFNHHIMREYGYKRQVLLRLLIRSLFRSKLSFFKRTSVFTGILRVYLRRDLELNG